MENNKLTWFWVRKSMRDVHVTIAAAAIGMYVISVLSGIDELRFASVIAAIIGIFHFLLHTYFHRQYEFLSNHQKHYSMPKKKIAGIGGIYLAFFLLFTAVGMVVLREIYQGTLVAMLGAFLYWILAKLFGAAIGSGGIVNDGQVIVQDHSLLDTLNQVTQRTESPWEAWVNVLQVILVAVGLIALLILAVVLFIGWIRKKLESGEEESHASRGKNLLDREERISGLRTAREPFYAFSANGRIRRMYKNAINRGRRRGQTIPEWMSPKELEEHVAQSGANPGIDELLHATYEKARYSKDGCSEEDLKQVRVRTR